MISSQCLFVFLAVVAVAFGQNAVESDRPMERMVVHEVNLNQAFDAALPNIQNYLTKNGYDPMEAPDVEIPLSHFPGMLKTKLHLHHGHIQQLSTVIRTGDIILQYSNKKMSVFLNVGWKTLDLSHQYSLRYMIYNRKGDCFGRYHDLKASMLVEFDRVSHKIDLKFLKFVDVGDFKLQMEGHLTDKLINLIMKVVTKLFRNQVLHEIEAKAYVEVRKKIEEINELMPSPVNIIETKELKNDYYQSENIAPYKLDGLDQI